MASYEEILKSCTDRMQSSLNNFSDSLKKIRTGRANPAMLDGIMVDYYGNMTPLNQCCSITVEDSKTLSLSPWDKGLVQEIDKSIQKSDLGFNPSVDKSVIIINVPPLTQERRAELVKFLGKQTENYRVSLRNIRKESNEGIKKLHKSKEITEDESKNGQSQVQELTDKYIAIVNSESASKEEEITKI